MRREQALGVLGRLEASSDSPAQIKRLTNNNQLSNTTGLRQDKRH